MKNFSHRNMTVLLCSTCAALRSSGSFKRQRDDKSAGLGPSVTHTQEGQHAAEAHSNDAPRSNAAPDELALSDADKATHEAVCLAGTIHSSCDSCRGVVACTLFVPAPVPSWHALFLSQLLQNMACMQTLRVVPSLRNASICMKSGKEVVQ